MIDFPAATDEPYPIPLGGGLDTETPVLRKRPGWCIGGDGYEPKVEGGYARLGGFLRYDGQQRPSEAPFTILGAQGTFGSMAVGDIVTGAPSGATGKVAYATTTLLAVASVTGAFASGDVLTVGGFGKGTCTLEAAISAAEHNAARAGVEEVLRSTIGAVPGLTGTPVRGLGILYGTLYAWRDHDVSIQKVWKATASGWVEVPMLQRVAFTAGTIMINEGETLTRGGVTATVRRVLVQTGDPDAWSGGSPASGWMIISDASGAFTAGAATSSGGGACNLSGAQEDISLTAGGKWELKPYNFLGGLTMRLYGADGVNDLIEFDGEVLAPIPVSMPVKPKHVEIHKGHLWASFGTSIQRSSIQYPYQWAVLTGSAELAMGDTVTGFKSVAGSETESAMLVTSKDRSAAIYGDSVSFRLATLSVEVGAKSYTLQEIGRTVALDDAGMRDFTPTQSFGNFTAQTITDHIRRLAQNLDATASVISKKTGRYRLFLSDKRMLSGAPGKRWSWMFSNLAWAVNVACEGEIGSLSTVFVGCDDGYVREMDVGRSMDGVDFEYWLKTSFSPLGMVSRNKNVPRAFLEVQGQSSAVLRYSIEADYGDGNRLSTDTTNADIPPPPLQWDIDAWDVGVWDGKAGESVVLRVRARGENFAFTFYGNSKTELPHELHELTVMRRPLRRVR